MRLSKPLLILAAMLLVGCGAGHKKAATPEPASDYDWSEYKGNFAPGGDNGASMAKEDSSSSSSSDSKPADSKPSKTSSSSSSTTSTPTPTPTTTPTTNSNSNSNSTAGADTDESPSSASSSSAGPHKASKAKIRGESVSSIGPDALAASSAKALKSKVVSTNLIVGPDYEMVQVVLKNGSVQIVRPASTPDQSGPKLRAPKLRKSSLSSSEAGYLDEEADVLVLVQAPKGATSKKALKQIVKK